MSWYGCSACEWVGEMAEDEAMDGCPVCREELEATNPDWV